jgi:glycosyltransferase involved in cell wall biosynthesis
MKFSVLLSIYKKENVNYFNQAITSIWNEQTLKPNQIVLVKDGPLTFELDDAINKWQRKLGKLLVVVELPENVGLGAALNEGLKHCKYDLVARMDTNDISVSDRFEKQVKFMKENRDVVVSSGTLEEWSEEFENCISKRFLPVKSDDIMKFAKIRSPINHPACIFYKHIILSVNGYPPFYRSQDYALWSLLLTKGYKMSNLSDVIYKQRAGNNLMARRGLGYFKHEINLLKFQRKIGFITNFGCMRNIVVRFVIRISPIFIKNLLYRHMR